MKKLNSILFFGFFLVFLCGCSANQQKSYYQKGHHYYVKGELTNAIPYYIKCISYFHSIDYEMVAYAYQDLATICHLEGNNKMAYEINEHSVEYFRRACLQQNIEYALCLSAIYKANMGNRDEAITLLRHIHTLSTDSTILNLSATYCQLLQYNPLPILLSVSMQPKASELYNAVEMLKYELYKKTFLIKIIIVILISLSLFLCIYIAHSGLLLHLHAIRKEEMKIQMASKEDFDNFSNFLRQHPEELKKELFWNNYAKMCAVVNIKFGHMVDKLSKHTLFNETEIRLCVLVLLDLQRNQIADILPYAKNSVGKLKNTVSKKLGTDGRNLRNKLFSIIFSN